MIKINSKIDCCGCNACAQRCPKSCISMIEDDEGFKYPHIDSDICIECGICEKVCPIINHKGEQLLIACYAMKNSDDSVRRDSSSGGVFTILANWILDREGVVFGARFDEEWNVVHDYIECKEDLYKFRSSKYMQSSIGNTMKLVEIFLKQGKSVLFSGTPCQVAGLKFFLRKDYSNLYLVDFVCHGVPSSKIWNLYLNENFGNNNISSVNFRDKSSGWFNYSIKIVADGQILQQKYTENPYMKTFLSDYNIRPCCYCCKFKSHRNCSDITIADYWGVDKITDIENDDKGISLVMPRTEKGINLLKDNGNIWKRQTNPSLLFQRAIDFNACFRIDRAFFWNYVNKYGILGTIDKFHLTLPYKRRNRFIELLERFLIKTSQKNYSLYHSFLAYYFK